MVSDPGVSYRLRVRFQAFRSGFSQTVFLGLVVLFVSIITPTPPGRSHIDPARSLVDGDDMALGFD